jgi:hypothetical protein
MSNCKNCKSKRVAAISAKCSDLCWVKMGKNEHDGYVPDDMGIDDGTGDYVTIDLCLACGQVQGKFPLPPCKLETGEDK